MRTTLCGALSLAIAIASACSDDGAPAAGTEGPGTGAATSAGSAGEAGPATPSGSGPGDDGADGSSGAPSDSSTGAPPPTMGPEDDDPSCSDGFDNDEDGLIDCDDVDCTMNPRVRVCPSTGEDDDTTCDDGVDNDRDGFLDCDDFGCSDDPRVTVCAGASSSSDDGSSSSSSSSSSSDGGSSSSGSSSSSDGASSSGSSSDGGMAIVHDIAISGFAFVPNDLTISVGDTVRWTNMDGVMHSVESADENNIITNDPLDSPLLATGAMYQFTFDAPGLYLYRCLPHAFMTGQITVE